MVTAVARPLPNAALTSVLALLIRGSAVTSMLCELLLLALVFAGHMWNDDFIMIRFVASASSTIRGGDDCIVILLLAPGSGASGCFPHFLW